MLLEEAREVRKVVSVDGQAGRVLAGRKADSRYMILLAMILSWEMITVLVVREESSLVALDNCFR